MGVLAGIQIDHLSKRAMSHLRRTTPTVSNESVPVTVAVEV